MCLAIPGQIVEFVDEERFLARVDVSGVRRVVELVDVGNQIAKVDVVGVRRNINVSLLADEDGGARPGDWVLIHVGFAISVVDEAEALATRRLLEQIGSEYEAELEEFERSRIT